MKNILRCMSLVCACLLALCLCTSALAQPRYPEKQGLTTDAAASLSASTVEDLTAFNKVLKDKTGVQLYVASVDFLDGATLNDYAAGLRVKWQLGNNDLLLLMAVGEDKFGSYGGDGVNGHLSSAVQQKLLSAHFADSFLAQQYDAALATYIPALATEIGKAYSVTVPVSGLFGTAEATAASVSTQDWADRWTQSHTTAAPTESIRQRVTDEDVSSGFSLGKVLLTIFLLMVIFGGKSGRRAYDRNGCGCGCAPFSSILAGLGLWNLWGRKR